MLLRISHSWPKCRSGVGSSLVVRCSDADNWYALRCADGAMMVYRMNGAVVSGISNATPYAEGDVVRFAVKGSTLTWYRNGQQAGTVADTALTTGNPGLRCDGSTARFESFAAGLT